MTLLQLFCNEEGKLEQLPFNRGLRDESGNLYDYIADNFMIVGLGDEDFTSLPPEYIEKYSQLFCTARKSSTLQTAGLKFCRMHPLNSRNLKNRI